MRNGKPPDGHEWGGWAQQLQLTVSVHTHNEVVSHGPCLAQLVRVAIMYHVIAVERTGQSVLGLRRAETG